MMTKHSVYHFHSSEIELLFWSQLYISKATGLILNLLLLLLGQDEFNVFKCLKSPKVDRLLVSDVYRICIPPDRFFWPIHRME